MKNLVKKLLGSSISMDTTDESQDSFADNLAIELRQVASDSIIAELEMLEKKYLSRILKNSHVPILSITFVPLDRLAAKQIDEFMKVHSEVDGEFKEKFLEQILHSEYRTAKNCKALLAENFFANFQLDGKSLDEPTSDEEFQISLRGKRIRFSVIIDFAPLRADIKTGSLRGERFLKNSAHGRSSEAHTAPSSSSETIIQAEILIDDAKDPRTLSVTLPCLIGRESSGGSESSLHKVEIFGTYISRNQLSIFSLDKKVYAFVPEEATLLPEVNNGFILQKLTLEPLGETEKSFRFGQTNNRNIQFTPNTSFSDYPRVRIRLIKNDQDLHVDTPLPILSA
jgi:hypothetical protein